MKNVRVAYIIGIPAFLALMVLVILIYVYGMDHLGKWIVIPVLILTVLYVSQTQIQWWYSRKKPPKLIDHEKLLLEAHSPFYAELEEEEKERFERRLSLLRLTRDIKMIDQKNVPDDIGLLICAPAIELSFYDKKYFLNKYQHIVLYPHPFVSPQYGNRMHISEVEHEDGVLIFSVEQLVPSLENQMVNLVAYEWAQAYLHAYDGSTYVKCIDVQEVLDGLFLVIDLNPQQLRDAIGLEDFDTHALALSIYFKRPQLMMKHMPTSYRNLNKSIAEKQSHFSENETSS